MKNPKISIVTVSFNSEETIEETIRSVVDQDYPNLEYVIVDGKSTDGTMDIVNKYKDKISTIVSEKDDGIFDAFNKGVKLCTGDYIGIINSDDFFVDNKVISDIAKALETSGADSAYADLVYVKWKDTNKITRYFKGGRYKKSNFRWGWMPPHPTFFVKREAYEKFGMFDIEKKISNDYELVLRFLYKHKLSTVYLPRVIIKMREGGNSSNGLNTRYKANMEDRWSWRVNDLKMPFYSMYLKPIRKIKQFYIPSKIKKELSKK